MQFTIDTLREQNLIIFEAIVGSRLYGTNLPSSDTDIKGVFIQPIDSILRNGLINQVSDEKNDIVFYELSRFLHLIIKNNPNILELLNVPDDCKIYESELFQLIKSHSDKFISKNSENAFVGYAITQIRKAKGYNKKINWEEVDKTRKDPLDFCYIIHAHKSYPLKQHLEEYGLKQNFCGVVNVPNAPNLYALFHDHDAQYLFDNFSREEKEKIKDTHDIKGYKGIVKEDENGNLIGNEIRLSSIPKSATHHKKNFYGNFSFNKDAYASYCKKYKEYQEWLKNRNQDRFRMNKEYGKKYDSKNMAHTFRLLITAKDIALRKGIIPRRSSDEIEKIMKIRYGEYDYKDLIQESEELRKEVKNLFQKSELPEEVDDKLIKDLILDIRKKANL